MANMATQGPLYQLQSGTRSLALSAKEAAMLTAAATAAGVEVRVFSGGQPSSGPNRLGSHRHDFGNAADITLSKDGRRISWENAEDRPLVQKFVAAAVANGATGIGAGEDYMVPGSLHVGFGAGNPKGGPMVWGADGKSANAPGWLKDAAAGVVQEYRPASAGPRRQNVTPEARQVFSMLVAGDPAHSVAPLSPEIAAGAVGNMMQESFADLRPAAKGAGGELGIGQWMPDRYANMVAWTTANGLDPNSREGQALFYSHELQESPTMAALAAAKTPAEAASIIATKFERAGNPMMDRRMAYAADVAGAPVPGGPNDWTNVQGIEGGNIATVAPTLPDVMSPPSPADIAVNPVGADKVVRASMTGDATGITRGWNDLVTNIMTGGNEARKSVENYFAAVPENVKQASAAEFGFNPGLWKAVPETIGPLGLGGKLREPLQKASADILSGGGMMEQLRTAGVAPEAGQLSTPVYDDTAATPAPAEQPTPMYRGGPEADAVITKDPLQAINSAQVVNMATSQPDTVAEGDPFQPALPVSSVDYAMGTGVPEISAAPTGAPLAYVPPAATPAGAVPSIATKPPSASNPGGGGMGGRIYRAVSQPIMQGSKNFWDGPMTQPFFTQGGGGATMPYSNNTGMTTTDVHGNKVSLGVFTDSNGNQHTFEMG